MKIGLLGAGRIGRIHGGNIAAHPRARLAAVADADAAAAQRLAASGGATISSVDAIIADRDIDAVVICTPTDTHADLIERAVRAGKSVFCEKPLAMDAAEAFEMWRAAAAANAVNQAAFVYRFVPALRHARDLIRGGAIGEVTHFRSEYEWNATITLRTP